MIIKPKKGQKISASSSEKVFKLIRGFMDEFQACDKCKEHFFVLGVSRALNVTYLDWVSMGCLYGTIAEPRGVFKGAILHSASSIILIHNHPSGNTQPSNQDIKTTKELVAAGKILKIEITDHVIVCDDEYYSFADEGKL